MSEQDNNENPAFDFKLSHGKKYARENNKIPPKWMKETKTVNDKYANLKYELAQQYENGEIGDEEYEIKNNDLDADEKNELKKLYVQLKNKQSRIMQLEKSKKLMQYV